MCSTCVVLAVITVPLRIIVVVAGAAGFIAAVWHPELLPTLATHKQPRKGRRGKERKERKKVKKGKERKKVYKGKIRKE